MKPYIFSLAAGLLIGIIYSLIQVRSPAPPVVALIGLLGILIGAQVPPVVKAWLRKDPPAHSWLHQVRPHVFGSLPTAGTNNYFGKPASPSKEEA